MAPRPSSALHRKRLLDERHELGRTHPRVDHHVAELHALNEFRRGGERILFHAGIERAALAEAQQHPDEADAAGSARWRRREDARDTRRSAASRGPSEKYWYPAENAPRSLNPSLRPNGRFMTRTGRGSFPIVRWSSSTAAE